MAKISFTRRRALQTLALIPATLPLARALGESSSVRPKRLVLVMQNNGTQQANFWPDEQLRSPILDHLFLDPATGEDNGLKAKTNLVKGVYVPSDGNGTNGNQHDMGFARMFTGERLLSIGGQPWGGGISVDQIVAKQRGIDSLALAVLASQYEPSPKPGFGHRESFSYLGPATLKHPRKDPLEAFRYLFGTDDAAGAALRGKLRKSVLDSVAGNLSEVSSRLGSAERAKLDYHLTAIRDVERHVTAAAAAGACSTRPAAPPDYLAQNPNCELNDEAHVPELVSSMVELTAGALLCGMTSVATLQLGYCGGKWGYGWQGINLETHGDVAHLDTSDAGSDPINTARAVAMNQYCAGVVRKLATALDAVPEGDGTVLDNTLLVWANELGRGDHSQENVPIVLIGKAGGAIPQGGRVIDRGRQVFNRLGCTILTAMDLPVAGFGDAPDCGTFEGLL
jgi:hypothetical protein